MLHSINYCMCVFLKFICIYFFLYYRGPCVRRLFTGLIMYLPSQNKEHCIVLYCIVLCSSIIEISEKISIFLAFSCSFTVKNDNIHSFFSLFWLQILNLPASLQNKRHGLDSFHGHGPYCKILTEKEPIRDLPKTGFAI